MRTSREYRRAAAACWESAGQTMSAHEKRALVELASDFLYISTSRSVWKGRKGSRRSRTKRIKELRSRQSEAFSPFVDRRDLPRPSSRLS
jgi:hypothetical protein